MKRGHTEANITDPITALETTAPETATVARAANQIIALEMVEKIAEKIAEKMAVKMAEEMADKINEKIAEKITGKIVEIMSVQRNIEGTQRTNDNDKQQQKQQQQHQTVANGTQRNGVKDSTIKCVLTC